MCCGVTQDGDGPKKLTGRLPGLDNKYDLDPQNSSPDEWQSASTKDLTCCTLKGEVTPEIFWGTGRIISSVCYTALNSRQQHSSSLSQVWNSPVSKVLPLKAIVTHQSHVLIIMKSLSSLILWWHNYKCNQKQQDTEDAALAALHLRLWHFFLIQVHSPKPL